MKKYTVSSSWRICGSVNTGSTDYETINELLAGYKKSMKNEHTFNVKVTLSLEYINSICYTKRRAVEELEYILLYLELAKKGVHIESVDSQMEFLKQYGLPSTKEVLELI